MRYAFSITLYDDTLILGVATVEAVEGGHEIGTAERPSRRHGAGRQFEEVAAALERARSSP